MDAGKPSDRQSRRGVLGRAYVRRSSRPLGGGGQHFGPGCFAVRVFFIRVVLVLLDGLCPAPDRVARRFFGRVCHSTFVQRKRRGPAWSIFLVSCLRARQGKGFCPAATVCRDRRGVSVVAPEHRDDGILSMAWS